MFLYAPKTPKLKVNGFQFAFFNYFKLCLPFHRFEIAIFVLIFLNMVIMAFEHHGQREIFHHILTGFNSFFSTIYALGKADYKIIYFRYSARQNSWQ